VDDYLRKKLLQALDGADLDADAVTEEFLAVIRCYTEHHRHYHNLDHVNRLLALCDELEINDLHVILAVFYHDTIYHPGNSNNEEKSADFARESLGRLGVVRGRVDRVCVMILATANHLVPQEDPLTQLFLDLDMAILGSPREEYQAYAEGVRKEHHLVPDFVFRKYRKKFLKSILAAESIFQTDLFREKYEAAARANIEWELSL